MNQAARMLFLAALMVILPACIGNKVAQEALFPPAQLAWKGISEDVLRGIEFGVASGDLEEESEATDSLYREHERMGAALEAENVEALQLVSWSLLLPWAERGVQGRVDSGEISSGVGTSLTERITNFTEAIATLTMP